MPAPTHRLTGSKEYKQWARVKQSCDNPHFSSYKNYGAKGITYDKRWSDFQNFYEDMGQMPKGYTLTRKDETRPFEKDNCEWVLLKRGSKK